MALSAVGLMAGLCLPTLGTYRASSSSESDGLLQRHSWLQRVIGRLQDGYSGYCNRHRPITAG